MRRVTFLITSIALAAIVFGFLCYCQPWLMTAREQSQLWLCSIDYLGIRLSEPGGLARYIGEFFVQFYYYILWGAIITALLVLAMILAMVARRLPYMEISSRNLMPAMVIFCIIDSPDIPLAVATRHQRTDDIANGSMSDIALFTTHS